MKISVVCDWCDQPSQAVAGKKTYCRQCGHRADVAQRYCDCRVCRIRQEFHEAEKGVAA